jgi:hypothetical protein
MHSYETSPRKDKCAADLISDMLPFGPLSYVGPNAASNAVSYVMRYSRSHDAVIPVYDDAGNAIETHENTGEFKESLRSIQSNSRFKAGEWNFNRQSFVRQNSIIRAADHVF